MDYLLSKMPGNGEGRSGYDAVWGFSGVCETSTQRRQFVLTTCLVYSFRKLVVSSVDSVFPPVRC